MQAVTLEESSQVKETPKKTIIKPKYFDTPDKPKTQSARLQKGTKLESGKRFRRSSLVTLMDSQSIPLLELFRKTLLQELK